MAFTIKCPKCGAEMNMDSRVCPVCGKRRLTGKDKAEIVLLIVLLIFGYMFISSMRAMAKRMDNSVMDGGALRNVSSGTVSAEYPTQEYQWIIS